MPTLNIEDQLRLSIIDTNLRQCILVLRELAESGDLDDRTRYRNAAYKLEGIRADLGLK